MSIDTINANIMLHTKLADIYKETEPHYRPENVEKVESVIKNLQEMTNGDALLDIGCGQGFIIDIAKKYFQKIRGIDITPAMLEKIDLTSERNCDISVSIANVEAIPHDNESFDVCTAYAVLHHLNDISVPAQEIYRVLKKGGVFYSSLDPNFYFWDYLKSLNSKEEYHQILKREINNTLKKDMELHDTYDIPLEVIDMAEAFKHVQGGFKEEAIIKSFLDAGFSEVRVEYNWFLGQGYYIHSQEDNKATPYIDEYLQKFLPMTKHLYKYISVFAKK